MIQVCIFDLDGTLTNTLNTIAYFVNTETARHGLPPAPVEHFKHFVGDGARMLVHRVLAYHGVENPELENIIVKNYNAAYDADFLYLCTLYDGIEEMIAELRKRNLKLAVLSNKPQPTTEKVVKAFFGKETFAAVFGQREGVPLKPDPAGVFEILDLLDCEKSDCLYIGDTSVDVKTGKAGGVATVGVLWGFRSREELEGAGASFIIEKPAELIQILNKQSRS